MKKLILILIFPVGMVAQNGNQPLPNQTNPPPVQQVQNFNPVNNVDINDNVDRNINIQVQQQVNEDNDQQDNSNKVNEQQTKKEEPCPDCDKIKKATRDNYGNNGSGNYSGGAKKFKMKKTWKRFCYNISHRSGGKKMRSNYSMCFNW